MIDFLILMRTKMTRDWLAWSFASSLIPRPWGSAQLSSQIPICSRFSKLGSHDYFMTGWKPVGIYLPFTAVLSEHLTSTDFSSLCCPQSWVWGSILAASSSDGDSTALGRSMQWKNLPSELRKEWDDVLICNSPPGLSGLLAVNLRCLKQASKQRKKKTNPKLQRL